MSKTIDELVSDTECDFDGLWSYDALHELCRRAQLAAFERAVEMISDQYDGPVSQAIIDAIGNLKPE